MVQSSKPINSFSPAASVLFSMEGFGFSPVDAKLAKYADTLISQSLEDLAQKIALSFKRVIESIRELINQAVESLMFRLTTTEILGPTQVDELTFKTEEAAKRQIQHDLNRPLNTRFVCNGTELSSDSLPALIEHVNQSTINRIKKIRIYNMFQQGFFGTAFSLTLPMDPTEKQFKAFSLDQGADYTYASQGTAYAFKTSSETTYALDTKNQTITGHRLITPLTGESLEGFHNAVGQPGIPDRPYYVKTTYDYGRNTIEIHKLDPKYFPSTP